MIGECGVDEGVDFMSVICSFLKSLILNLGIVRGIFIVGWCLYVF